MRKLMWFTLGFGAACAWGSYLGNRFSLAIVIVAVIIAVLLMVLKRENRLLRTVAMLCAGVAAGILWFSAFDAVRLSGPRALNGQTIQTYIRASDYSRTTDYGYAVDGQINLDGKIYDVCAYLDETQEPLQLVPGDMISGQFRFKVTTDGNMGDSTYHQGNGTFLLAYQKGDIQVTPGEQTIRDLPSVLRHWIESMLESAFPEDTVAFAKALFLGDATDLSYEVDTAFKASGIRHIIAVSGLHVSILFSAIYLISGKRRGITALLGIPVLLLFAAVTGFTPSVTRACVMQILMILAMLLDREYDSETALSFAALIMLVLNPLAVTSVSLQLSVGCMAGISLAAGRIREWILSDKCLGEAKGNGIKAKLKRSFAGSVSITLSSLILTAPLSAMYFGTISIVGVLTNLLTLWIVAFLFCGILGVCLVGLFWIPGAQGIAWVVSWGIRYVIWMARMLSNIPVAVVYTKSLYIVLWLVFCYIIFAVFMVMKKKRPAVLVSCAVIGLCAALIVSWVEPLRDECRVSVLDVGQGQCILLQSDGRTYMVDCGGLGEERTADEAAHTLFAQGVTKLEGVIITHFDSDHCEGAVNLLSRVDADLVLLPDAEDETGTQEAISDVTEGTIYPVTDTVELAYSDVTITVIPSHLGNSDNESGLCVLFQSENCAILITGDRNTFGEQLLLHSVDIPDLDVLIVGHHGSKYSTGEILLEQTKPEIAIISVGENNPYGHPAEETLERLKEFGCTVYRTDLHGTIIFRR